MTDELIEGDWVVCSNKKAKKPVVTKSSYYNNNFNNNNNNLNRGKNYDHGRITGAKATNKSNYGSQGFNSRNAASGNVNRSYHQLNNNNSNNNNHNNNSNNNNFHHNNSIYNNNNNNTDENIMVNHFDTSHADDGGYSGSISMDVDSTR